MRLAEIRGAAPSTDPRTYGRLQWMLLARLVIALLSLAIATGLDGLGRELLADARRGLYLTVSFAFAATLLSIVLLPWVRHVQRFVAVQIATDVVFVSCLVLYSGARESVFTFLYVLVTIYGAVFFERRGAMLGACLSSIGYGVVLLGVNVGLLPGHGGSGGRLSIGVLGAVWGVQVGALLLVGVLASILASELQRTGRALVKSTSDLQRLRELHQQTVESIMSGLLTTDSQGRVTSFNPEAERMTGLRAAEAIGRDLEEIIPGARGLIQMEVDLRVRGADARRVRLSYRNRREEDLYLGLAASILRDATGQPLGHVVIFQDVTAVVGMEADLRRSERLAAVGEMAAKIAHEIRNPLASISGSIQILRGSNEAISEGPEASRLMDIAVRETDRLNALITDFLQYSRPGPLVRQRVDVSELMGEVVELCEARRPESVRIEVQARPGVEVLADPGQLKQVLWNLCINALQAMPDGGRLRLSVTMAPGEAAQEGASGRRNRREGEAGPEAGARRVEIVVEDTGVGIAPEVQERIFEPFFTTKREGTGLGLATVHRIVESHAGSLLVDSKAGRGTVFRIQLPCPE